MSLKYVTGSPFDNRSSQVRLVTRHPADEKPLGKPMTYQFINTYMRQWATMLTNVV